LSTIDTYSYAGPDETVLRIANSGGTTTDSIVSPSGDRLGVKQGSTLNWLLPDLHGNVAAAQDATEATVVNATRYDAYGETLATGSGGGTPVGAGYWKFQGRLDISPSGLNTPLYDMSARFYSPGIGAFTQMDSVMGGAQNPLSMNRFLYAGGNPASMIDPSGHVAINKNLCGQPGEDRCDGNGGSVDNVNNGSNPGGNAGNGTGTGGNTNNSDSAKNQQSDKVPSRTKSTPCLMYGWCVASKLGPASVSPPASVSGLPNNCATYGECDEKTVTLTIADGLVLGPDGTLVVESQFHMLDYCQSSGRPSGSFAGGPCTAWWKTFDKLGSQVAGEGNPYVFLRDSGLEAAEKALEIYSAKAGSSAASQLNLAITFNGRDGSGALFYRATLWDGPNASVTRYGSKALAVLGTGLTIYAAFSDEFANAQAAGRAGPEVIARAVTRSIFGIAGMGVGGTLGAGGGFLVTGGTGGEFVGGFAGAYYGGQGGDWLFTQIFGP
jgi:RHS repeat-associated protein